ncbi:amidohydrolase family protein [Tardisphaera miroshnichenkoae]
MKTFLQKVIALEEHFTPPDDILEKFKGAIPKRPNGFSQFVDKLAEIGPMRISEMDQAGIDIQVLSTSPGIEQMNPDDAVSFSVQVNDYVAKAIETYPSRLAAFAALPTPSPEKAADELERTVKQYGFKGGFISGHSRGRYLDDPFFDPILERAEELAVPIYLHPAIPPQQVLEAYYSKGLNPEVAFTLSTSGFGWHIETAIHVLRMILGGAFDRHPKLQLIVGHLGETLPFMMDRLDRRLPVEATGLQRPISSYLRENVSYTISGFNFTSVFLTLYLQVGAERIMFSTDYPYSSMAEATQFLEDLPISEADKQKIAHLNAEKLMHF